MTGTASHAGGTLKITIEEPAQHHLFLRFAYTTTLGEKAGDEDAAYVEFVKSAYHGRTSKRCAIRTLLAGDTAH